MSLAARAGKDGRLFGSVTTATSPRPSRAPVARCSTRKRIQLPGHIKTTGAHVVTIDLHPDVVASVPVTVTAV